MPRSSRRVGVALASATILAVTATPALAHASFDKAQVPAETELDLTFNAPQEQASTNEKIEALAPSQFTILECMAPDNWTCTLDVQSEAPKTIITWQAGSNALLPEQGFTFHVRTPRASEQGIYAWPVIQTYANGAVAEWIGEDAPTIQVGDSDAPVVENTEAPGSHGEDQPANEEPSEEPVEDQADEPAKGEGTPAASDPSAESATSPDGDAPAAGDPDGPTATGADTTGQGSTEAPGSEPTTDDDPSTDAAATISDEPGVPVGMIVAVILLAIGGGAAFLLRGRVTN